MIRPISPITIPTRVEEKLREVRVVRDRTRISRAVAMGAFALITAMAGAMLIDWTFTLFDTFWRSVLTFSALAVGAVTLTVATIQGLYRKRALSQVATEVDQSVPEMEERWSTVAELAAAPLGQQRQIHSGMLNRLSTEAEQMETEVVPVEVVSKKPLHNSVAGVCGLLLILIVAGLFNWQRTSVLLQRFWAPGSNISATRLTIPDHSFVVARGEPLTVQAVMSGEHVNEATVFLKSEDTDEEQTVDVRASGDSGEQFVHRIRAAETGLTYRIRAGDGQTDWTTVTVANRPEIAGIRFRAIPPAYTMQDTVDVNDLPEKVSIVEGSVLEVDVLPRQDVQTVAIHLGEDAFTELSSSDGRWYKYKTTATEDMMITAILTEQHGLENLHPPICRIHVHADSPPSVEVTSPSDDMTARADDEIEIQFSASDDMGISKAELVIHGESEDGQPNEIRVVDIPLGAQQNKTTVNASVPLDLTSFELEDGDELTFSIRVYDTHEATASSSPSSEGTSEQMKTEMAQAEKQPSSSPEASQNPTTTASTSTAETTETADGQQQGRPQSQLPSGTPKSSQQAQKNSQPETEAKTSLTASTDPKQNPPRIPTSAPTGGPTTKPNQKDSNDATSNPTGTAEQTESKPSDSEKNKSATEQMLAEKPAESAEEPQNQNAPLASSDASGSPTKGKNEQSPNNTANGSSSSSTPSGSSAPPSKPQPGDDSKDEEESPGASPEASDMTLRMLDVGQTTSTGRMTLQIDKWSGSFAGKKRRKLELEIAPTLEELKRVLKIAENRLRESLDGLEQDVAWAGPQDRLLHRADTRLKDSLELSRNLRGKTDGTAYAFIGMQLGEIADTNLVPAKDALWQGMQANTNPARQPPLGIAWQQVGRARDRLKALDARFERIRREHALKDSIEKVKEMYRVYVEDSMALLEQDRPRINNYQRKMEQMELDEEYLRRLEEVLAMRQKLVAEFARILSNDPRLLRRFLSNFNKQTDTLRDQLTLLTERQKKLDGQIRNWNDMDEPLRDHALTGIIREKLTETIQLSQSSASLQEEFETWLPLELDADDNSAAAVREELAKLAASAKELENKAANWRAKTNSSESKPTIGEDNKDADAGGATDEPPQDKASEKRDLSAISQQAHDLYEGLYRVDALLLELAANQSNPEVGPFVINRLGDTRRLITDVSGWIQQMQQLQDRKYHIAAAVEQQKIAQDTNELTADLANLEQQLVGVVGGEDDELPEDIAALSRQMFATLDTKVAGNQMGAVFSLKRNRIPTATKRTRHAVEALIEAERLFDDLVKRAIEEGDKLPVQDPIADLLDDPTLDELLLLLASEQSLAAALGIPLRPSNLQVIGDFLRPINGAGGSGGRGGGMVMSQMASSQRMMDRASEKAAQRAQAEIDKALSSGRRRLDDWNKLASELEDRLLQGQGQLPPKQYRKAIEQYFDELSRETMESDSL